MVDVLQNILKCTFLKEKFYILIKVSLKPGPHGLIDNKAALLAQVIAWNEQTTSHYMDQSGQFFDNYIRHHWTTPS